MSLESRTAIGREGEDRAFRYLRELGYTPVGRNVRVGRDEIDALFLDGETVVFVEVRSRKNTHILPEETVDAGKRERLSRAMTAYLEEAGWVDRESRLDLIAIDSDGLRHTIDLFNL
jgi:putative endonuclease